jgi:hypothetical protein
MLTTEKADFYIAWKWEYLRRNDNFKTFFNKELEVLYKLWEESLANPSEKLPRDIGHQFRCEVHEVNGRQENKDQLLLTLRRIFEQHNVWIEISESGQILSGPYICGRRFKCQDITVDAYKDGGNPSPPQELSAHAISDSVVVKDYPAGKERETLVTIKLSRPIEEIIRDIRHLQTLWNAAAPGNDLGSLVTDHLKATPEATFRDPGLKRAIGLFLWDFSESLGGGYGSGARAVREAEARGYLGLLNNTPSNSTLSFWRERAKACIDAAEVLSYTLNSN